MSDRAGLLLLAAGLAAADATIALLTWGTAWLILCVYLTIGAIAAAVFAFVDMDGGGSGDINGDGGAGLGGGV